MSFIPITNNELTRIFKELKSKHQDVKLEAARKLHLYLLKHSEDCDIIFEEFYSLLQSDRKEFKMGTFMAINKILTIGRETRIIHYVNKIMPMMFKQLRSKYSDNEFIEKVAECLGNLARAGGTYVTSVIEKTIDDVMIWIQDKQSNTDNRRYAGTLVLREFCRKMPILTFNKLFDSKKEYKVLFPPLKDKNLNTRETAVECINECIGLISLRKDKVNLNLLEDIYNEVNCAFVSKDTTPDF
jgi:hypothetical protein